MSYDGVVLAGGAARRLGGAHKPGLVVGTRRLLDIALAALDEAQRVVVAGPSMSVGRAVQWVREEPPGGGPVAGLAAALAAVDAPTVVVLAADLPFVTAAAVTTLVGWCRDGVAAVAVDADGVEQPLLACYLTDQLRAVVPQPPQGASMRSLLRALSQRGAVARVDLGGDPAVTVDCDTAADLDTARSLT